MTGELRRQKMVQLLDENREPLSGTFLASRLQVSRQVIVQDITILRSAGVPILSTHRGYLLQRENKCNRVIKVRHDDAQIADELYTIVDAGGRVLDVLVDHEIYGELRVDLVLSSRKDVDAFVEQLKSGQISPLKQLTNDYHYHTIAGDSLEILDYIEEQLDRKGYLRK